MDHRADVYIFDVDGTITPTNGRIADAMADALMALHTHVPVLLSTGRSLGGLAPLLARAPLPGPHAVSNGAAMVMDGQTSHVFNALTPTDIATIGKYLDSRGFITVYCLADGNMQTAVEDERIAEVLEEGAWPMIIGPYTGAVPVLKILTLCLGDEEDDIRQVCAQSTEIHRTQYNMIEWTAPGSNKGVALEQQLELLGLADPYVVAIGDSENDLPLLAKAHYALAMPQADDQVKRACHAVLDEPLEVWIRRQALVH